MKKILITGASGFIGKNLLDYFLKKNYYIYILLRNSKRNIKFTHKYKVNKNFKSIYFLDFTDLKKKLLNYKIDYLVHAATYYVKNHKSSDVGKIVESNILAQGTTPSLTPLSLIALPLPLIRDKPTPTPPP